MRSLRLAAAGTIASLALGACGGGDGDSPSSGAKPGVPKPRTLTAADYPVMRDWIVHEGIEVAVLRPLCRSLDRAPDTAVVEATRDACDRVLSIAADLEEKPDCDAGDRACAVRYLRVKGPQLAAIIDVAIDFNREVGAVLAPGPCRDTLTDPGDVAKARQFMRDYARAIDAFEKGDDEALDALDTDDDDVDDPTPCRPEAKA